GCDVSPDMIAQARATSDLDFVVAPAERLPGADGAFTLVHVSMGFHWFDQEAFLNEANRVLSPRGHLSIDNCYFLGRIEGEPAFATFNEGFWSEHFPSPFRNKAHPDDAAALRRGFSLAKEIDYEIPVTMSLEAFAGYLMTQSNALTRKNADLEETESMLMESYGRFFGGGKRTLAFGGNLKLYAKNDC
ncbi:MAG: class I SAM-dependent methyltransferase, partial [Rhodospirillaceae bacterium]